MAPDSAKDNLTAARCVDCGKQLTIAEFRDSRGSAHRCARCRAKGGYPAAAGTAASGKQTSSADSRYWTGREKLTICSVCDEGIRMRQRNDGEWIAYEEDEDRRHRHRG